MNISRNTLESLLRAIDKKGKGLTLEEVYAIDKLDDTMSETVILLSFKLS
jgi:hypothetical protein